MTSTIPPLRFGQVRYEINANPTSTPGQATPVTLTSNARHLIFELRSIASDLNPAIPEGEQAPEPAAIDPVWQLPTVSTIAPGINPMPLGPTQVQLANVGAVLLALFFDKKWASIFTYLYLLLFRSQVIIGCF
ncbi:hypothetical protein ACOSQ3_004846 [Xanthoceras sorbifolium]